MASRRMFSLDVCDTDDFLEMPLTSQALFFHLGLRADDYGFVSAPKKILKMTGCKEDDLRVLISKNYIIPFENGVVVIVNWNENNYIRADRRKPTRFQEEYKLLTEKDGIYQLSTDGLSNVGQLVDKCQRSREQYRVAENSTEQSRTEQNSGDLFSVSELLEIVRKNHVNLSEDATQEFFDEMQKSGWMLYQKPVTRDGIVRALRGYAKYHTEKKGGEGYYSGISGGITL